MRASPEPGGGARLGRLRSRVVVGIIDQGVSSGGNLVAALVGARYLSSRGFGAFATGTAVCLVVHGLVRSLVTEPALVDKPPGREERRSVLRSSVALSLVFAVIVLAASALAHGPVRGVLAAFAVVLPIMLVHDSGRYLSFAMGRPEVALGLDVIWTSVQIVVLAALVATSELTPVTLVFAWGCTPLISAVGVAVRLRVLRPSFAWVRRARDLSWRFAAEWSSWAGAALLAQVGLGVVAGVAAVGALSATQVLFGPINILYTGAIAVLLPEGQHIERGRFRRGLVAMSVALAGIALCTTIGGALIPDSIGRGLFGDTWELAHRIMVPAGLVIVFSAANAGAIAGLRSMRAVQASLATRMRISPGVLVLPLVGAAIWGAPGYAWVLAGWVAVSTVVWWRTFQREFRREDPDAPRATSWDIPPGRFEPGVEAD